MAYNVIRIDTFDKQFDKLTKQEKIIVCNFEQQLSVNPFVGKCLWLDFLREKKFGSKRVYYLVYEEFVIVFMVGISDKRHQQAEINRIKRKLKEYFEMAENYITLLNFAVFMLSKAFIKLAFSDPDIPVYFLRPSLAFLTVSVSSLIF